MKKLLVVVLALLIALSACSFAMAEEQVTLNLWHRWSGKNEEILNECVKQFEAQNPGIKIEITAKAGEYFELLQSMTRTRRRATTSRTSSSAATTC